MNAKDVMSREPQAVRMIDRLDAAARILWNRDCGFVPVVDGANVLVGVLTDRDVCMASYMQGKLLGEIPVLATMSRQVASCRAEDPLSKVMQVMQATQVHRLPVVDARGVLIGVISTNDLVRAAHARPLAFDVAKVMETLAKIGQPRSFPADADAQQAGSVSKAAPAADEPVVAVPAAPAAAATAAMDKVDVSKPKASKPRAKRRKA